MGIIEKEEIGDFKREDEVTKGYENRSTLSMEERLRLAIFPYRNFIMLFNHVIFLQFCLTNYSLKKSLGVSKNNIIFFNL